MLQQKNGETGAFEEKAKMSQNQRFLEVMIDVFLHLCFAQIKARENMREVVISHRVDESTLEMVLQVPPDYPLTPVKVDAGKRFGVSKLDWSKILMQLGMYLTHKVSNRFLALCLDCGRGK